MIKRSHKVVLTLRLHAAFLRTLFSLRCKFERTEAFGDVVVLWLEALGMIFESLMFVTFLEAAILYAKSILVFTNKCARWSYLLSFVSNDIAELVKVLSMTLSAGVRLWRTYFSWAQSTDAALMCFEVAVLRDAAMFAPTGIVSRSLMLTVVDLVESGRDTAINSFDLVLGDWVVDMRGEIWYETLPVPPLAVDLVVITIFEHCICCSRFFYFF